MTINPFDFLPPPNPITALWATRALLVYPDKHMADDCLASLESSISITHDPGDSNTPDMMSRLLNLHKSISAGVLPIIPKTLEMNIKSLAQIIRLNVIECRLLELAATLIEDEWLHTFCSRLPITRRCDATYIIAAMLDISYIEASKALATTSGLHLAGLLDTQRPDEQNLAKLLALASESAYNLSQNQFNPYQLLEGTIELSTAPKLHPLDFSHIRPTLDILKGYTNSQTLHTRRGANILIYGPSGGGKSELAKSLMKGANLRLLEVPMVTSTLQVMDPSSRLKAYLRAQACLKPSQNVLLFDHFEGIFQFVIRNKDNRTQRLGDLAWLYRIMEYNPIPTFWLTSNLEGIPPELLSRMDAICEIPAPSSTWHTSMLHRLRRSRQVNLNPSLVKDMSGMTPGVMDRVIQTAALFEDTQDDAKPSRVLKFLVASFQNANSSRNESISENSEAVSALKLLMDALQSVTGSSKKPADKTNE